MGHRQMRIPRMMVVINKLLVIYYGTLGIGYGFLIWFAFSYSPEGDDYISAYLRDQWSTWQATKYYVANADGNMIVQWLLDSFGTFFFTCVAVTDAFIVM